MAMKKTMEIPELSLCEPPYYMCKKSSYAEMFEILHCLRQDGVFCDIKLKTDNSEIIFCHKVVLASASSYFKAMFTHFAEKNQDIVIIKEINPTALKLLIDFIYLGKIKVTDCNARMLLPAANLLQLQEVKDACAEFLQKQLCLTNCNDTYTLADLHSCTELITRSELYIQQHFSHVVELDEFLSISSEQMVKLIASEELIVLSEAKVFESVIAWVKHDISSRICILPQLMEYIRLPLTSKDYILKKVIKEPLIINCLQCMDYVNEAFNFHLIMSDEIITIPDDKMTIPRQRGDSHKVILVVGGFNFHTYTSFTTEMYDPKINQWQSEPPMKIPRLSGGLAVIKDTFVFYMGGYCSSRKTYRSVDVLDLSSGSPFWKPFVDMIVPRRLLGVGVINNHIYAVGGSNDCISLNSAEVFDCSTQKWRMISSMSTRRTLFGIGVLNNLLYAVGGYDSINILNSVECYNPCLDKWTPIANMKISRCAVGVGVLDDVLYVVGGQCENIFYRCVETYKPTTGVWAFIPPMNIGRSNAGVAVLDGLLYVFGGHSGTSQLNSVEFYNPNTSYTWTMVTGTMHVPQYFQGAVVIDKP